MQLSQISFKKFISKLAIVVVATYAVIIAISLLLTLILYFGINVYKTKIEYLIHQKTGYNLTIANINISISATLAPKIILNGTKLANPQDPKQIFEVKYLEVIPSYSSLWKLTPIFSKINIDGTDLNFERSDDGSIFLNGFKINNTSNHHKSKSKFDIEEILLKQKQIKLSNININYIDNKSNLPKLSLYNLTTTLEKHYSNRHSLTLSIGSSLDKEDNAINGTLTWNGAKLSNFESLEEAKLIVATSESKVIDAQIKNNKLQFFYANFNIKNLNYIMSHHQNLINFPQLGGSIRVSLMNNDHYTFEANNLTVSTDKGYVLDNKNISGNYTINKLGSLSILDTDLSMFNNLVAIFPIAKKLFISGTIEIVKLSWLGNIVHPTNFNISANFTNLGVKSNDENIPSFNNISGNLSLTKESGMLDLSLKDSTLLYPKVFLVPYKFNSLTTKLNWKINPDKSFEVDLGKTIIDEVDFKGNVEGKFSYIESSKEFLYLTAHIDKILTSKVGNFLPIVIGMPVHKWLNAGLIGGYGKNASLLLSGYLSDFPFTNGKGKFYIDADVDHAKLNYVDTWPPLEDIMGKFQIRNQKIIIKANSAKISGNNIESTIVIIPDMTASDEVYLTADGIASGSTSKFMTYLSQTPVNEIIGHIPDRIMTTGNGKVAIHLMVPFSDPLHTKVDGSYTFSNNSIKFDDLPIPLLTNTNGSLFFSEHGLKIDAINTVTLNSKAKLAVVTDKTGTMHFSVFSPNLDYSKLSGFYLPFISSVFRGNSPTNINFDIAKKGILKISANSNLDGVTVLAPSPIGKESTTISSMKFNLEPSTNGININFDYANTLYGKVLLNSHGKLENTLISVGSSKLPTKTSNQPKILIAMNTKYIDVESWLKTVLNTIKPPKESVVPSQNYSAYSSDTESSTNIFPIELLLNTPNLMLNSTSYQQASSDILVNKNQILFNLNYTFANGFGNFVISTKTLNIILNKFNLMKSTSNKKASKKPVNTSNQFANLNQISALVDNESSVGAKNLKTLVESVSNEAMIFPNVNLIINDFYYENIRLASANIKLKPQGSDLIIESSQISGQDIQVDFHGANYCLECMPNKSFVEILANIKIKDLGHMLDGFGYGAVVENGSGTVETTLQWNGKLQDFNLDHTIAAIKVDLSNGNFLKVSTGGVFGEIIGILNLQTLTNFIRLDFSKSFSNGFYFDQLKITAYLLNNVLTIKSLYMTGPLATIQSYGTINIGDETIDTYMNITPKLGTSFAIGVGAATLNPIAGPIVGVAVYAGEWALGNPLNKLFSFGFHITGPLNNPTITKTKISDQALNNLNSAIGLSTSEISNIK
jgi:uncharacterized protein (TIGR02099 family)